MLESQIESSARTRAKRLGWYSIKIGMFGLPDRLFFQRGVFLFVEFKQPGKKATPLQLHKHRILRDHGCDVYVCDSADECLRRLAEHSWWLNSGGL